jgi:hypothetical protein
MTLGYLMSTNKTPGTPLFYKTLLLLFSLILTSCNIAGSLETLTPTFSSNLSTLSTSSTQVAVGGSVTLTMTLKDAGNKAFAKTTPALVLIKSGGSSDGSFGTIVNNGSGIYTATFTGTTIGTPVTISATVNGVTFLSTITVEVISSGLSMYFCPNANPSPDYLWATVANWYLDSGCSDSANSLPLDGDSVYIEGDTFIDQPGAISLASFVGRMSTNDQGSANISIQVGGVLTMTYGEWYGSSGDSAIVTFNSAENYGTISGDATFNDGSYNFGGIILGDAIFNTASQHYTGGTISGDATFNDNSYSNGGIILGDATFNHNSNHTGTISGNATFNDDSYNSYGGIISGDATFNGSSSNLGAVTNSITCNTNSGFCTSQ